MIKRLLISFISVLMVATLVWAADQQLKDPATSLLDITLYDAYTNLDTGFDASTKIGTGATQVARGNHAHTGMVSGPLSATAGAMVCTTGTAQYTGAACGGVGSAGMVKWGATGVPATASAGTDYVATETDPVVLAINGIVKSNTSTIAAATRADYAAAQIIGTYSAPQAYTAGTYSLPSASAYGFHLTVSGVGIVALPAGAAGMNGCIKNIATGATTIDPNGSEVIVRDGTAQTGGVSLTLSSGAGNYVCLIYDGTVWTTLGYKGTIGAGT